MDTPSYRTLWESGELEDRAEEAASRLASCDICPRNCGVDRTAGELGDCRTGRMARLASLGPHFGEEHPLSGRRGSGTVFFSGCNLNCSFCQNEDISQGSNGQELAPLDLAGAFLRIQEMGCHNLNLVTPTHVMPQILEALPLACERGLNIPIVWNCGGYESMSSLALLDGLVDIYMPDFKFSDSSPSSKYLNAPNYPQVVKTAIAEMHRQVGDLGLDESGLARRGLLVRHLIMPRGLAGTSEVIRFLASQISEGTYLNIMNQYRPCHRAHVDPEIGLAPDHDLWLRARSAARRAGLRLDEG